MKPWMVWAGVAVVVGFTYLASQQKDGPFTCPPGQIFIPQGFGGACVVGSWR